ncbi:MAG TPA: hypothetical protein VIL85_24155 [Thermomicrobiales bacterium]|jgi:hypothetical protein
MLILTGPPAAGKNTIGALLARQRERCAVIDVDVVRAMIVQPHRAPWHGAEGWRQHRLGVHQACRLASGFVADGWEVIILDLLSDSTLPLYRQSLAPRQFQIVQLLPTWAECARRFRERGPVLTDDEFALLYRGQEQFTAFDLRLDNTTLAPADVATTIAMLL